MQRKISANAIYELIYQQMNEQTNAGKNITTTVGHNMQMQSEFVQGRYEKPGQ